MILLGKHIHGQIWFTAVFITEY